MEKEIIAQNCPTCGRLVTAISYEDFAAKVEHKKVEVRVPEGVVTNGVKGGLRLWDSMSVCTECAKPEQWAVLEKELSEKMLAHYQETRDSGRL